MRADGLCKLLSEMKKILKEFIQLNITGKSSLPFLDQLALSLTPLTP